MIWSHVLLRIIRMYCCRGLSRIYIYALYYVWFTVVVPGRYPWSTRTHASWFAGFGSICNSSVLCGTYHPSVHVFWLYVRMYIIDRSCTAFYSHEEKDVTIDLQSVSTTKSVRCVQAWMMMKATTTPDRAQSVAACWSGDSAQYIYSSR